MRPGARSAIIALVLLAILGVVWPRDRAPASASSFGVSPFGHRAALDLLQELGVPAERSFARAEELAPDATIWWISPDQGCEEEEGDVTAMLGDVAGWLEAGGTAVLFFGAGPVFGVDESGLRLERRACPVFAGIPLPVLALPAAAGSSPDPEPDPEEQAAPEHEDAELGFDAWLRGDFDLDTTQHAHAHPVQHDWGSVSRELFLPEAAVFEEDAAQLRERGYEPRAWIDDTVFAVERVMGEGRLVVVADGRFLENRLLGRGDAAPFVVDLVRALGVPSIDERSHGFRREQGATDYLVRSSAAPVFAGLVVLGLLALARGRGFGGKTVSADDTFEPVLAGFVDSLAALYEKSRDHRAVAEAYRAACLARVRRHHGWPASTPEALVLERVGCLDPEDALAHVPPVPDARALQHVRARVDRRVEEILT